MAVKKLFSMCWLLSFFIIATPLWGSNKIVRLSTSVDYSPFSFQKGSEKSIIGEVIGPGSDSQILQGYSWEVVRESFHNRGYTIHLTVTPWARALMYMEAQDVDLLFPTAYTKKRAQNYHYSKEEIHRVNLLVYTRKDSLLKWSGLESLHGKPVTIIRGFSAGPLWNNQSLIDEFPVSTIKQAFGMLDKKRVVGYVTNNIVTDNYLQKNKIAHKYTKLPSFDLVVEYLAGMKTNTNVIKLLEDFDEGKREIKRNKRLDKIIKKWNFKN
jgi:polar amino acid transport system substrate-binding protein